MTEDEKSQNELIEIVKLNGINPNDIDTNIAYPGSIVKAMISLIVQEQVAKAQREILISVKSVRIADEELREITNQIENWILLVNQAVTLIGYGDQLRFYLTHDEPHKNLIELVSILNAMIEKQHESDIDLIPLDHPQLAEFNTAVRNLATAINRFIERKDLFGAIVNDQEAATMLQQWFTEYGASRFKRLAQNLKRNFSKGRDENAQLNDAIWRCCCGLKEKYGAKWSRIAKECYEQLAYKSPKKRTSDEKIIFTEWKNLTNRKRSEQVRRVWRSAGIFELDEGKI